MNGKSSQKQEHLTVERFSAGPGSAAPVRIAALAIAAQALGALAVGALAFLLFLLSLPEDARTLTRHRDRGAAGA
jgi:hypothetical protein